MGVSGLRRTVGVPVRSTVAGLTAVFLLVVGAGCGSDANVPTPLKDDPGSGTVADETPDSDPPPEEDPVSGDPTPDPIDVCALVGAERVQEIFGQDEVPTVERPKDDELAGAIPGVGTAFYCTYRWAPGQTEELVRVSLMTDITVEVDPKVLVEGSVSPEAEALPGAGEAAMIDRSESFGHGLAIVLAAEQVDDTLTAVLIRGPLESEPEAFVDVANEFLEKAPTE